MKIKIFIVFLILALLVVFKPAMAETGRNQVRQEERQEAKATITQVREENRTMLSELKLKRSESIYKAIRLGLTKRYEALTKIKNKLEARISKNPMNKDTTTATNKLKELVAIQASYTQNLALFDAKFTEITTTSTTKFSDLVNQLKTAANMVKADINSFKKILREATVLLAQSPKLSVTKTEE